MKLRSFNFSLLIYTLLVILWGAWVRISKSGDGCGEHWPLCHGEWIPQTKPIATWIEFSHRLSTGIYGILILILCIWCYRKASKTSFHLSLLILFFTLTESLIGAQLVLKGLVGADASMARAYWMAIHQMNSLLLTASLVFSQESLERANTQIGACLKLLLHPLSFVFLFVSAMGALASLSGTLFPSDSLIEGLIKDFSQESHIFVKLRIWHPAGASLMALLFFLFPLWKSYKISPNKLQKKRQKHFYICITMAVIIGCSTLLLLSPTILKISHLLMAHLLWVFYLRWQLSYTVTRQN